MKFARLSLGATIFIVALFLIGYEGTVQAIAGADIFATGTWDGNRAVGNCALSDPNFQINFTPNTNDAGGMDYLAVVHTDGYGTVLDVDIEGFAVGGPTSSIQGVHAAIAPFAAIAARPVTAALYDVGDPGAIAANSAAGLAFARGGVLLDTASYDPIAYEPDCANYPTGTGNSPAPGPQPSSPAAPQAPVVTYFNPGDGRLNAEAGAPVAVYCQSWGIQVYGANGGLFVDASNEVITAAGAPPAVNTMIASGGNARLYRLTTGAFQVNYLDGGYEYVFAWDNCPMTWGVTNVYNATTWELVSSLAH